MTALDDVAERPQRRSLDRVAAAVAAIVEAPLVVISVLERSRQQIVGEHGLAAHRVQRDEECAVCREVAVSHRPIVIQDAARWRTLARRGWGLELVAYAGVPLVLEGGGSGTLAVFSPARRSWQSRDLVVLRSMADAAAAILDAQRRCDERCTRLDDERGVMQDELANASAARTTLESRAVNVAVETAERERVTSHTHRRITGELEKISVHDELTGLLNRRGLYAAGNAQLEGLRRDAKSGLLLYIDIDGLKATNDRAGHAAGDDLLHAAACVLQSAFRDTDTIARLGGDEFVVVVTDDTPRRERSAILERLSAELGRCNRLRDPHNPLTWSLGFVSIDSNDSLDALMSEADRRMYAAKRARHRSASRV